MRVAPLLLGSGLLAATMASSQPLIRTAATSLTLPATPPSRGFTTERTLDNLSFDQPVTIVAPPGETNRLFIVEKPGRIRVIPDLSAATLSSSLFLDISTAVIDAGEEGLLAMAFHPDYATNGFFYVWYTLNTTTAAGSGRHDRLSRFRVSTGNPNAADPNSEQPLITQRDEAGNHNGGELIFGPDGYLYISLGDEGGGNDQFQNAQRIDRDFFAGILRLDVDRHPGSLAPTPHPAVHTDTYAVPPDNPFVGATAFNGTSINPGTLRTEFWAIGLRNPWRMAFDPADGRLFAGDVGQNAREEIDLITRGGNYGWPFREGFIAGPGGTPPAAATLIEPIHDYPRSQGFSVTGGIVYRGSQLSQLYGAYLFSDYGSGNIWALRSNGDGFMPAELLTTDPGGGITAFAIHPGNGDILLADLNEGSIRRLIHNSTPSGSPFPATLSATGAFSSTAALNPNPGLIAYEPNVSFWSDRASKMRWFGLRDDTSTFGFDVHAGWTLPNGAVWVKHFELPGTVGNAAVMRQVETRFLVKTADGVYGITYRWNDDQTDATLVAEEGEERDFTITENGVTRTQTWRYPSRAECLACHTAQGGFALSFNTRQLNRDHAFPGGVANQITALAQAGYLSDTPPAPAALPNLTPIADTTQPIKLRARSYLDANCSQCHRPGGAALGIWDARSTTPIALANIVNGGLVDAGDDGANRVVVPGDPSHSRLLHRMAASNGATRMPPIATRERDMEGEALLQAWINDLATPRPVARLANLSGRALVGAGDEVLIPGFFIEGSTPRRILIRAIGPALADSGVTGFVNNPTLTLFSGLTPIASNTRWDTAPNSAEIRTVAAALGAFPLPEGGADSALLITLDPGPYTAHVADASGAGGIALFELYDGETTTNTRLVNTSVRAQVGGGAGVIIPGLFVSDGAFKRVLIRAVGPGLADPGVSGFLRRPVLTLFAGQEPFLSNAGWSTAANASEIAATADAVGAFPLQPGSADSAILVTLSAGGYTLHVSSADNSTGIALVEVYEVD